MSGLHGLSPDLQRLALGGVEGAQADPKAGAATETPAPEGEVKVNAGRMAASGMAHQLAQMARIMDAEDKVKAGAAGQISSLRAGSTASAATTAAAAPKPKVSKSDAAEAKRLAKLTPEKLRAEFSKMKPTKQEDALANARLVLGEDSNLYKQMSYMMAMQDGIDETVIEDLSGGTKADVQLWYDIATPKQRQAVNDTLDGLENRNLYGRLNDELSSVTPVEQRIKEVLVSGETPKDPEELARLLRNMTDKEIQTYASGRFGDMIEYMRNAGKSDFTSFNRFSDVTDRLKEVWGGKIKDDAASKKEARYAQTLDAMNHGGADGGPMTADEAAKWLKDNGATEYMTELLPALAGAGNDYASQAYETLLGGYEKLAGGLGGLAAQAAKLTGPGSARVKGDIACAMAEDLAAAQKAGKSAKAHEIGRNLGRLIESDPGNVFTYLETDAEKKNQVQSIVGGVLKWDNREGDAAEKAVGGAISALAAKSAKESADDPGVAAARAKLLGQFMAHVEMGINDNADGQKAQVQKGAKILGFALDVLDTSMSALGVPKEVAGKADVLRKGVDALAKGEIKDIDDARMKLTQSLYGTIDSAYKKAADPKGTRAASGDEVLLTRSTDFRQAWKDGRDYTLTQAGIGTT